MQDQQTVLVTGATGFVGRAAVAALVRRGFKVRAYARASSEIARIVALGAEVVRGELTDRRALGEAMRGARVVLHAAGKVTDWGSEEDFRQVNLEGTRSVLGACQDAGVARLVHVSSLTVLGLGRLGQRIDEATPYGQPHRTDFYTRTKQAGERLVSEAQGLGGLETVVVRPGAIWGPGDPNILPRILGLLRRRALPYIGEGRNVVVLSHVENLADGLVLAVTVPGAAGQIYHLTDARELTAREIIDSLADAHGLPRPRFSVPYVAVYQVAALMEDAARALGRTRPPPLTRYAVRLLACDCRYDFRKPRKELGYEPRVSFEQGVRALVGARADRRGAGGCAGV